MHGLTRRWLWVGEQLYSQQDLDALLDDAVRCHFTDLVVHMHRYDGVQINSELYTMTPFRPGGQLPMDYITDRAHDLGIRVHPWWIIGSFAQWMSSWPHWKAGVPDSWNTNDLPDCNESNLNFSLAEVRQALADATADICTNNPNLDGLDIDYIRYEPGMVQEIASLSATDIDQAVQRIYDAATLPLLMSGVPPYISGDYVGGWDTLGCGQHWLAWVETGLIQTVKAMNYLWPDNLDDYITKHYDDVLTGAVKKHVINGVMPFGYEETPMSSTQWEQTLDIVAQHDYELAVFDDYLLNQNDAYKQALADRPLENGGDGNGNGNDNGGDEMGIVEMLLARAAELRTIADALEAFSIAELRAIADELETAASTLTTLDASAQAAVTEAEEALAAAQVVEEAL